MKIHVILDFTFHIPLLGKSMPLSYGSISFFCRIFEGLILKNKFKYEVFFVCGLFHSYMSSGHSLTWVAMTKVLENDKLHFKNEGRCCEVIFLAIEAAN